MSTKMAIVVALLATVGHTGPEQEFESRVSHAIERGLAWLRKQQGRDGSFASNTDAHQVGVTALSALTLVHGNASASDPQLKKALTFLKGHYPQLMQEDGFDEGATYSLSLLVMTLDALYNTEPSPQRPPAWARHAVNSVARWLLSNRRKGELFGYPTARALGSAPEAGTPGYDMSNTQFAIMALWCATRFGHRVKAQELEEIGRLLLSAQETEGARVRRRLDPGGGTEAAPLDRARGFGYVSATLKGGWKEASGSMTSGGLCSLLLMKAMLMEQEQLTRELGRDLDQGIWDACAWLAEHYTVSSNPPEDTHGPGGVWHRYYLYSLERACIIAGRKQVAGHDWYHEGAEVLLAEQGEDGAWASPVPLGGDEQEGSALVVETCFALLFLERACPHPKRSPLPMTPITPSGSR